MKQQLIALAKEASLYLMASIFAVGFMISGARAADTGCGVTGVPIDPFGNESIWNSTYTPLDAGDSFVGCIRKATVSKPFLMIQVFTDAPGQIFSQFSVDGRNIDSTYPLLGWSTQANVVEVHCISLGERFWRFKYTNGTSAQTVMRMGAYETDEPCALQASYNNALSLDADAIPTRPSDFQEEVILGRRDGIAAFNRFGFRDDLDTADGAALVTADNITNVPTIITTASTFTITYNSVTDGAGTTGAIDLTFFYLDADGENAEALHILGSDGSDITSFTGLGINRIAVSATGSADANTNNINITATTGGSVQAFIPALLSVTQTLLHHVPLNGGGVLKFLFFTANKLSGSSPVVIFRGIVYNRTVDTNYQIFSFALDTQSTTTLLLLDNIFVALSAGDVFYVTAQTTNNDTAVGGKFGLNTYESQ